MLFKIFSWVNLSYDVAWFCVMKQTLIFNVISLANLQIWKSLSQHWNERAGFMISINLNVCKKGF